MHTRLKTKKLQFCSFSKILLRCFYFFACSDILSNFWDNRCNDLRSSSPSSLTRDQFLIKSEHLKHLLMTISWRQFPYLQNHLVLQLYKQRLIFFFLSEEDSVTQTSKSISPSSSRSKFSSSTQTDFSSSKFYASSLNGSSISLTLAACVSLEIPAFLKQLTTVPGDTAS